MLLRITHLCEPSYCFYYPHVKHLLSDMLQISWDLGRGLKPSLGMARVLIGFQSWACHWVSKLSLAKTRRCWLGFKSESWQAKSLDCLGLILGLGQESHTVSDNSCLHKTTSFYLSFGLLENHLYKSSTTSWKGHLLIYSVVLQRSSASNV